MSSIRLSPKHGLNPSLMLCFYCGEALGVAVPGMLKDDRQAPHKAVWDHTPCTQCAEWMKRGVILLSVRDGEEGDNPYRTGGFAVVTADYVQRAIQPEELQKQVLDKRVAFIHESTWKLLGLPMPGKTGNRNASKHS